MIYFEQWSTEVLTMKLQFYGRNHETTQKDKYE